MQALALLFVAFVGLASCQQYGNGNTYADQGRTAGGASRKQLDPNFGGAPYGEGNPLDPYFGGAPLGGTQYGGNPARQQNGNGNTYADQGRTAGGASRGKQLDPYGGATYGGTQHGVNPSLQQNGNGNTYADQGRTAGGASRGKQLDPYGGAAYGGAGQQQPGYQGTYGHGGAAQQHPGRGGLNHNNVGNAPLPGGSSKRLPGDFAPGVLTQQEAGTASHSTGGAGMGATAVGVVVAILVVAGIVGVAAFFIIRQRRSRMGMSRV